MEQLRTIEIKRQARVAFLGNPEPTTRAWIVCHGYGQLAPYFIRKFRALQPDLVIAPEGTHRFYKNGYSGRVGASWMTKEARELDISDNINYLDDVVRSFNLGNHIRLNVIGFSQGAATAARWAEHGKTSISNLILWSGVFPPDLELPQGRPSQLKGDLYFAYGDEDEFMTMDQFDEHLTWLQQRAGPVKPMPFKGAHDINEETLIKLSGLL